MRTTRREEEFELLETRPFYLCVNFNEDKESLYYSTRAIMDIHDMRDLH